MSGLSSDMPSIVKQFARQKVLVVGDLMLDRYIRGSVSRISPEAPVPVVRVTSEHDAPGGAANVARNICSLGAEALLCGVVGNDQQGKDLLAVLENEGVTTQGIMVAPDVQTTVKTRILAERQQVVRVDWDRGLKLSDVQSADFLVRIVEHAEESTGIVLADYAKGVLRQDVLSALVAVGNRRGIPIAFDPKQDLGLDMRGITVITPNRKEAFVLAGEIESEPLENPLSDDSLLRVAKILLDKWQPDFLVVTLGPLGMLLWPIAGEPRHISTVAREVFDVSGAGDTVVAALLLALASGAQAEAAARLANSAAGVVVGKVGTAGCSAEELLAFHRS